MDQLDRRHTLRRSTASAHEALEGHIGPLSSRAAYVAYARGLEAFRAPLERSLAAVIQQEPFAGWRPSFIAGLLAEDLALLNATPVTPESQTLIQNSAQAFGALYVLEGSALGAKVLWVDAQKLGLNGVNGAGHLQQQASLNSWRGFTDLLQAAPDLDLDVAVQSANAAFRSAENAMTRARANV